MGKYGDKWEMFSAGGGVECEAQAKRLIQQAHKLDTPDKIRDAVNAALNFVAVKYSEAWDTEPRNHMYDVGDRIAALHGIDEGSW